MLMQLIVCMLKGLEASMKYRVKLSGNAVQVYKPA